MYTPIYPYARPEYLEQFSNTSHSRGFNNNLSSTSRNQTASPNLRINSKNKENRINPSIQWKEDKNNRSIIKFEEDSSSIVESSYGSDEQGRSEKIHLASEPTLSTRPNSTKKKNINPTHQVRSQYFFKGMPQDVIRKILVGHIIDLNDIPTTAKNLMAFAGVSKFNQEFVRQLLTEEEFHKLSFEITKSIIPNLFTKLVNNKKEKFTQTDIDDLVHNWPYLTVDCSYEESTAITNRGIGALENIVCHHDLRGLKIINNLPEKYNSTENFRFCNNNILELMNILLSRKISQPLKVDFIFNNWVPFFNPKGQLKEKSLALIKKIQERVDNCDSIRLGVIDLSRSVNANLYAEIRGLDLNTAQQKEFRFNFIKMICNIALSHFAHTISLRGLFFSDERLALLLNEIQLCDKSSLQHLDLRGNYIKEDAFQSLIELLKSENICLKTIKLSYARMPKDKIIILADALKNNFTLELVEIMTTGTPIDHPIIKDKRIKIIESLADYI